MSSPPSEQFLNIYDHFTFLRPFYGNFETDWEVTRDGIAKQFRDTLPYMCVVSVVYAVVCFSVQAMMKNRQPFDLKRPLAAWNLFLAIFSFIGMTRVVPHLLYSIYRNGYYHTICGETLPHYGHGAVSFWCTLFVLSKIPELLDTLFIVLRKKPLMFLHWYHHITVMLYSWHGIGNLSPGGIYFIGMNYTVHAIMYFYYFLTACGIRPKWAKCVTIIQLSQMVVGVMVCASSIYYRYYAVPCATTDEALRWGIVMYSSYFALFLKFFLDRFLFKKSKKE